MFLISGEKVSVRRSLFQVSLDAFVALASELCRRLEEEDRAQRNAAEKISQEYEDTLLDDINNINEDTH